MAALGKYVVVKTFNTRGRNYREGDIHEMTAAEGRYYVKLGWMEKVVKTTPKKRATK